MSAAGRSDARVALDVYPTPPWCVSRLLDEVNLPGGQWVEPAAGDGAIIRAVDAVRRDVLWSAIEIRRDCEGFLRATGAEVQIADALSSSWWIRPEPINVVITNPPYALAEEFLAKALEAAPIVALLLRLDFLGSNRRASLFRKTPPDVHVLPNRPSFIRGKTDQSEYAWFVWGVVRERRYGRLSVLAPTAREHRLPGRRKEVAHEAP